MHTLSEQLHATNMVRRSKGMCVSVYLCVFRYVDVCVYVCVCPGML